MGDVRKARVAVVDDHPVFREGLLVGLRRDPDLEVVIDTGAAQALLELAREQTIDAAIVDVFMPSMSGISLTAELHDVQPDCRVLGLSVLDDPGLIADMLRAHACGFVCKTQSVAEILDALHQVLGGLRYLPPFVSRDAVDTVLAETEVHPLERLTPREREVFELLIRGHSNDEIATRLEIATRTVETHRLRITRKLSAHSIVQLQRIAARYGGVPS